MSDSDPLGTRQVAATVMVPGHVPDPGHDINSQTISRRIQGPINVRMSFREVPLVGVDIGSRSSNPHSADSSSIVSTETTRFLACALHDGIREGVRQCHLHTAELDRGCESVN